MFAWMDWEAGHTSRKDDSDLPSELFGTADLLFVKQDPRVGYVIVRTSEPSSEPTGRTAPNQNWSDTVES